MPSHSHGGVMRWPGGQVEQNQDGSPDDRSNVNQPTDSTGGSQPHNIMPSHYTLVYLMRK
jgi:hypothetical protein